MFTTDTVRVIALGVAICAGAPQPSSSQTAGGQLEEQVASAGDTSQKYALYLPPGYTTERQWPILFVLDPRGQALSALKLFQKAASELGWVVMSSYNSRSDSTPKLTEDAMEAMLQSAQERVSIDRSRVYLAGFSGTARAVLWFAVPLRGHIAGVIAVGGALGSEPGGPETAFAGDSAFAYFGAAGRLDFNYGEVLAMADRFGTQRIPYRVAVFDGPHSWPPPDVCDQAIKWLELRAMRGGRRASDSAWVRAQLHADLDRAAKLELVGQSDEALRLYEAVTRDYPPSGETSRAAERAGALRNSPAVRRYRAKARKLAEEEEAQVREQLKVLTWARSEPEPPTTDALVRRLKIAKLKETAQRGDGLEAASAERVLARLSAMLAFYEPRTYITQHAPGRALVMLEAATRIGPLEGESCALLQAALSTAPAGRPAGLTGQCVPAEAEAAR